MHEGGFPDGETFVDPRQKQDRMKITGNAIRLNPPSLHWLLLLFMLHSPRSVVKVIGLESPVDGFIVTVRMAMFPVEDTDHCRE